MEEYIIINGKKRRFECNFNSLGKALQLLSMDDLNGLVDITRLKPSTFPVLFSCCLNEGSRIEGEDWRISPEDTGRLSMSTMSELIQAFARQNTPDTEVEDEKKPKGEGA